jgi:hypothetical protein
MLAVSPTISAIVEKFLFDQGQRQYV